MYGRQQFGVRPPQVRTATLANVRNGSESDIPRRRAQSYRAGVFLTAPSLEVFRLIPLIVAAPFALARSAVGGWPAAVALTAAVSTAVCVGLSISEAGYNPTGSSIATALILAQYALLSLGAVGICTGVNRTWHGADECPLRV